MEKNPTNLFVVAVALKDDEGRILVQQRPPGKAMAGLWEFPGGKVDVGETPEQALCREVTEELGLDIGNVPMHPINFASESVGNRHMIMLLYLVDRWTGEPEAMEGQPLAWHHVEELYDLPMPPADYPMLGPLAAAL